MPEQTGAVDIRGILDRHPASEGQSALMSVLQDIQEEHGYLPEDSLGAVAEHLGVPISHIFGVVSFYAQFSLTPRGKHIIKTCLGTACHIRGGKAVLGAIRDHLKVTDRRTTEDGLFTLEVVRCLGTCFLAPVMMVDTKYYGAITPTKVRSVLKSYQEGQPHAAEP